MSSFVDYFKIPVLLSGRPSSPDCPDTFTRQLYTKVVCSLCEQIRAYLQCDKMGSHVERSVTSFGICILPDSKPVHLYLACLQAVLS